MGHFRNHVIPNVHFRKVNGMMHGRRNRVMMRTWFDQAGRKNRRQANRKAKAAKLFPRPAAGKLRPIVRCPTQRYNMKLRLGKGFSLEELKEAKIPKKLAPTIGIAVDHRRKNRSVEGMQMNVERLKVYKSKLKIFPAKSGKKGVKKGDTPRSELENVAQNTLKEIIPVPKADLSIKVRAITNEEKEFNAYQKMRKARQDKKFYGQRLKKEKAKAEAEAGRTLVHEGRILGTAQEWNGTWGWVTPLQKISHPLFRGNKLYCHQRDVNILGGILTPGTTVDFLLYADGRGLGAGDVRKAETTTGFGVADAAQDESLPEGWDKVWSEEHGEYYYWNKTTKESSWSAPEATAATGTEEDELPEGWTKNYDPENDEYYYWHAPTKTTTWERPRAVPKEPAAPEGEAAPAPEADDPDEQPLPDGPVLGQQRVKGRVEKWQNFFGWIAPTEELGEDLKPLLENRQDRIYCNWRDVREGTTIEAGSLVDFLLYADDNGLGASDVRLQKDAELEDAKRAAVAAAVMPGRGGRGRKSKPLPVKDAMAELERQWAEQDKKLGLAVAAAQEKEAPVEPSHGVADAQEMEDIPLLPGWEQHWSEEHSCFFYWHKTAKQASWERPCIPGAVSAKEQEKVWEGEGAEEGAAKMATPITPVSSWVGKDITPLTPATAADKEEARLATGQTKPSNGIKALGGFQGQGWPGVQGQAAAKQGLTKRPGTPSWEPAKRAKNQ